MLMIRVIAPVAAHVTTMTLSQAHTICATWLGAIAPDCPGVETAWTWLTISGWLGGGLVVAGIAVLIKTH